MKTPGWALAAACFSCLATALTVPDTHVVHERRDANGAGGLRKRSRPDENLLLPMRIGLKQRNVEQATQWLMDVSHPKSEKYGKHWTSEEVIEAFKPSDTTVESVKQWLNDSGIAEVYVTAN